MTIKKMPLRMCIVTREMHPKNQLIRVVKTTDGEFVLDFNGRINGRGAYVLNDLDTINKLIKTKALNRAFSQNVPQNIYDTILEEYLAKSNN